MILKRYFLYILYLILFISFASAQTLTNAVPAETNGVPDWRRTETNLPPPVFGLPHWITNRYVVTNAYLLDSGQTDRIVWTNVVVSNARPFRIPPVTNYRPVTNYQILFASTNIEVYVSVFYTNRVSNFFISPVSNSRIDRNFFIYEKVTNTNRFIVFTNLVITGELTNVILTNVPEVYRFRDIFPRLLDVNAYRSVNDLRISLLDYLFPVSRFGITAPQPSWMEAVARRSPRRSELQSTDSLVGFSNDLFAAALDRKKYAQLEFTPEEQQHLTFGIEQWDTKVIISGTINFKIGYGWVWKDENNPDSFTSFTPGFNMNQSMNVNVLGKFGDRITVSIEQSSLDTENTYEIAYKALTADTGLLRELKAGNISLNIPDSSHYIKFNGTSAESYGLLAVFAKNNWSWQTVLSLTTSKKGRKEFVGSSRVVNISLMDVAYIKRKYYVLPDYNIDTGTIELLKSTTKPELADRTIDSLYFRRMTEGVDYTVNNGTGEVILKTAHSRDENLVVRYTVAAAPFTTNSNSIVGTDNGNGDRFLYLWNSKKNSSQYMDCGYYSIGYRNFDPSRGFTMNVVKTVDPTTLSEVSFEASDYEINSTTGILRFKSPRPFPDPLSMVYDNPSDPGSVDSVNTMKITLNQSVQTYMLDFGIIPGTEHIYLNGRELAKSEYLIIYAIGELIFRNPNLINENDKIEVVYEYKPFFAGSQQFSLASRFDWKPSRILNMGSTLVYNIAQRESGGAPSVYATPDGSFLMDADGILNMGALLGLSDKMNFTIKAEGAVSVLDENSANYAIIDDFESSGSVYSLSSIENRWILAPATTNLPGINTTNRGKLLYKDYRDYRLDNSFTLLDYDTVLAADKIMDYGYKPGPYLVLGGHLDPLEYPQAVQTSLAMDYDFTSGSWAGAAISIAGSSGSDFSEYNEIVLWVKLQSDGDGDGVYEDDGSSLVEVALAVGGLNEDSDGDGVMDQELSRSQPGFEFNNALDRSQVDTYVGRGRLGEGDGYIQTEDLNRNGSFDTNDNTIVFPADNGITDITNAVVSQGGWRKITIRISSLNESQINILQHVSSVAVYVRKVNGDKGRLLVDSIDFKSTKWEDKMVDGELDRTSPVINGEVVSVYNNPYYAENRFYILDSSDTNVNDRAMLFERLHGAKTISEAEQMNEISMGIRYNLTNVVYNTNFGTGIGGTGATLVRNNSYAFDITRYRYMNFYFYVPQEDENGEPFKSGGDTYTNEVFVLILGNGAGSYYKWRIPLGLVTKDFWNKATVSIFDGLKLKVNGVEFTGYEYPLSSGYPNLKDVDYIEMGVETTDLSQPVNKGIVWIDEFYVSLDEPTVGMAFYLNPSFEYKDPIWMIRNKEIIGPLTLNSVYEYKNYNFVSSAGQAQGDMNGNLNVSLNQRLFRYLTLVMTFNQVETGNDTNTLVNPEYLQYDTWNNIFNYTLSYNMNRNYVPVLTHAYTESFYYQHNRNIVSSTNFDYVLNISTGKYNSSASVSLDQIIPFTSKHSIQPSFRWEDVYFIEDHSNFTNENLPYYLTNSSVYGLRDLKRDLATGLKVYLGNLYLYGGYLKTQENFAKIYDSFGFRSLIDELAHQSFFERYGERLKSMTEGFYFEDENLDLMNTEKYLFSLNGNKIKYIEFLNFGIDDSLSRTRSGYSYTTGGALSSRTEIYALSSKWRMIAGPTNVNSWVPKLNVKVERTLDFNHNSTVDSVEYADATAYAGVYYMQPLFYNGLFGGDYARQNALELVGNQLIDASISYTSLKDYFGVELILPKYRSAFANIFPKRYTFDTTLTTAKNSSSYSQSREDKASTTFPVRFSEILSLTTNSMLRPGDLNTQLTFRNLLDYNNRVHTREFKLTTAQTLFLKRNNNSLLFSYAYTYTQNEYFTNDTVYRMNYGLLDSLPSSSPQYVNNHALSLTANWTIKDLKEIRFWFIRINLRGSQLVNRDIFRFSKNAILFDGSQFEKYNELIYQFELEHSTTYQFSELVTGTLTGKFVVNQYAEVVPLGTSGQFEKNYFDPGTGFLIQLDLSIKI